jgi:DNA-binding Lrp family transcriptional regulator
VKVIGSLNFEGNIVPVEWFNHIKLDNNKPDLISIIILSDILYWYRPTTLRDESSGRISGYKKKFKSDLLQKSYQDLETLFGLSRDQIKDSLQRLEKQGLIKRIFRNLNAHGMHLTNVMFIQIFPNVIAKITEKSSSLDMRNNPHTPEERSSHLKGKILTGVSPDPHTYTETTPKNSTNNSFSLKNKRTDLKQTIEKLSSKEREMLDIWNEIIEEKDNVQITSKRSKLLNQRLNQYFDNDLEKWSIYCKKIVSSKFLMGEITNFKASIDWCLKEDSIIKIIEGNFKQGDRVGEKDSKESDKSEQLELTCNDPLWLDVVDKFKTQHGVPITRSWLAKLECNRVDNNTIKLLAISNFIANWIEQHYLEKLRNIFNNVSNGLISRIVIEVKDTKNNDLLGVNNLQTV